MGITLLAQAGMPHHFWVDTFNTAVYQINRLLSKVLKNVSPYEKLFQKIPNYLTLRVFGCSCFPYLRT